VIVLRYILYIWSLSQIKKGVIMESILALGIPYIAILSPVLILLVIFFFDNKTKKDKYAAMVEISKTIQDPSEIRDLLEDLQEKKRPIDYRRSGVVTLFVGVGLSLLGWSMGISAVQGAGYLVAAIGIGSIIAGYLYPNDSAEITKAVEDFEEK
jgi:hypothetical protein